MRLKQRTRFLSGRGFVLLCSPRTLPNLKSTALSNPFFATCSTCCTSILWEGNDHMSGAKIPVSNKSARCRSNHVLKRMEKSNNNTVIVRQRDHQRLSSKPRPCHEPVVSRHLLRRKVVGISQNRKNLQPHSALRYLSVSFLTVPKLLLNIS